MKIQLSDHFNFKKLLRFTLPSIIMLVFTSVYGVVDGFFVSNYVGKTPFTAVNFIMPFLMILGSFGFMFGTGGGALIAKTCINGSSELMSNISMSVVSMLYNVQLLKYAGEDGVAAYGVLMYVSLIFQSVFIGYSVGTAPIIGYQYGAQNHSEFKGLRKKSLTLIGIFAVVMFALSSLLAKPLSLIFVSYDEALLNLTVRAFSIFSFSFLFSGFAIFGSSFFTALNNGLISAAISFMRTLVFQIAAVLIFPLFWQVDGIWLSIVAAEVMAVTVTMIFMQVNRKKYRY